MRKMWLLSFAWTDPLIFPRIVPEMSTAPAAHFFHYQNPSFTLCLYDNDLISHWPEPTVHAQATQQSDYQEVPSKMCVLHLPVKSAALGVMWALLKCFVAAVASISSICPTQSHCNRLVLQELTQVQWWLTKLWKHHVRTFCKMWRKLQTVEVNTAKACEQKNLTPLK